MKRKLHNAVCENCGKKFTVANWRASKAKYCSYKCSNEGRATSKNVNKERVCVGCTEKYIPTTWNQKWCSRECFQEHSKTGVLAPEQVCKQCGKSFRRTRAKRIDEQKFCSRKCGAIGKTGRKTKRKPTPSAISTLDTLWSKAVKLLHRNKCAKCGRMTTLNSHHLFSRSNMSVRWDVDNGICLCVSHHMFGKDSAHKAPLEFVLWLEDEWGRFRIDDLRVKAKKKYIKRSREVIKQELKQVISDCEQRTYI